MSIQNFKMLSSFFFATLQEKIDKVIGDFHIFIYFKKPDSSCRTCVLLVVDGFKKGMTRAEFFRTRRCFNILFLLVFLILLQTSFGESQTLDNDLNDKYCFDYLNFLSYVPCSLL